MGFGFLHRETVRPCPSRRRLLTVLETNWAKHYDASLRLGSCAGDAPHYWRCSGRSLKLGVRYIDLRTSPYVIAHAAKTRVAFIAAPFRGFSPGIVRIKDG